MKRSRDSTRVKTTSLTVLLVSAFLLSALAGIGRVSAIDYTQYAGTLNGADWALRIPNPWNGMLVLLCRGYNPGLPNASTSIASGSAMLNSGFAVAASNYGAGGFSLLKGVNSTYQLTKYIVDTYHVTGKIFLVGLSMGGSVVLLLGQKYPEVYSGVLDMFGGKDWKDMFRKDKIKYQTEVAKAGRSYLYRLYNVTGAGHGTPDIIAEVPVHLMNL